jgi:RNA polymerase sigma-70 factor (ECF subfamily)
MWKRKEIVKSDGRADMDPDAELMLRYKAGDERSFDILFRKYLKYVFNISRRFFEQEALAEEIAQEVFTQIYLARESYEATAAFKTWLYRITLNKCLNEKRKGFYQFKSFSIDRLIEDEEGSLFGRELKDENQKTPLENLERAELEKRFQEGLGLLTHPQRVSFVLSRDGNLSYAEIAEIMQISENAVKSLIHRANSALKNHLRECFQEEK